MKTYYVYIMTSPNTNVLYTGLTNDLQRRVSEHKTHQGSTFTKTYNCINLVYYETFNDINQAIKREKTLKRWPRQWKDDLIYQHNPQLTDLSNTI